MNWFCLKSHALKVVSNVFFVFLLISGTAQADCRGCCSRHGGVVCAGGVTQCADGTPLSSTCRAKGCSTCDTAAPVSGATDQRHPAETITIANFNIQVFGVAKTGKPAVMETLGKIITRFDVVAIQEIRDKSGSAIVALEERVDALGENYTFVIGPRLGRTSSKEQYAYMYRADTLEFITAYTYDDTAEDTFHREPFIAQFKARSGDFTFVLMTLHTDPDDATAEINALPSVMADARTHFPNETHFLILGDLNADCSYYDEGDESSDLRSKAYRWLITNDMDTNLARSECTYDRIIMTADTAPHFTGHANVFRFDEEYGLSDQQSTAVSDHYPVYGVFTTSLLGNKTEDDPGCYIHSANQKK